MSSSLDRYFFVTERGSTVGREVRGGLVTFFTMAYIIVLNPLIIGTQTDGAGKFLGGGDAPDLPLVALATAVVAGLMTALMGVVARYPLALAWDDVELALPAFLTIVLMPFTYNITVGIGAGFVTFVLIKLVRGKASEIHGLMRVVAVAFVLYFAIDPVRQLFGVS